MSYEMSDRHYTDQNGNIKYCEWIAQLLLPHLYASLSSSGHKNLSDFIHTELANNSSTSSSSSSQLSFVKDISNYLKICNQIESNTYYFVWLLHFVWPLASTLIITLFLLPFVFIVFIYAMSFFLFLTKHWHKLKSSVYSNDFWQASYKSIAVFWESTAALWHGHEMTGIENFPESGPALLIYYHAAMPIDFYYVHSKVYLYRSRRMKIVADRFLFKVPGLSSLLEAFEVTPGSLESCCSLLKDGHVLAISPGGVREALFSDHIDYEIMWGQRKGFAKIAHEARVPIIPMFTQNSREALRVFPFFKNAFRWIYEKTKLPLVPIYGLFPVKLTTHIGKPIEYDESRSIEETRDLTKLKIEELIELHQKRPGSIFGALLDRFRKIQPKTTKTD